MDMQAWMKLLGKSQDDPEVRAALAAAGVKKIPKRDKDDFSVIFNLKGHGMQLEMTDEAYLKRLPDQDIGEGPLILSAVDAYLERRKSKDLYKGKLPYEIVTGMSREAVQKVLGPPTRSDEDVPADIWVRGPLKVVAGYAENLTLGHLNVEIPRAS